MTAHHGLTGAVPFGLLPHLVLSEQRRRAEEILRVLREAFGRERVFVELSDDGTVGSRRRLARVATFAWEVGASTVAAGEVAAERERGPPRGLPAAHGGPAR